MSDGRAVGDDTGASRRDARRLRAAYAVATLLLGASQLWAFAAARDLYPFAAWRQMMAGGDVRAGGSYFVLRGTTVGGADVSIPAAHLTDALAANNFGLAAATVRNGSFRLRRLHPDNAALLERAGGFDRLERGARVPELLRAWGAIYNERLPPDSPRRLRAARLDEYRWDGGAYADYERYVATWGVQF
ncbi:MAG: hypothetical protein LC800_09635 [Acidobacteria bacterium]|nr:hypothetical protein [Acidobacteriota bacterium]